MSIDRTWIFSLALGLLCSLGLGVHIAFAAETLPAGFAPGSIWLSKTAMVGGDSVHIFSVLYNSSETPIEGDVVFSVDDSAVGTSHFKLAAGETQVESVQWIATIGTHTFKAAVENASDSVSKQSVTIAAIVTDPISAKVAEPPPPSAATQYLNNATNLLSNVLASTTPLLASAASNAFNTTEALRRNGISYLENQLAKNSSTLPAKSKGKAGAATSPDPASNASDNTLSGSISGFFSTALRYIESALLFIFRSAALFYPFFAVLFFFCFSRLVKMVNRPQF